MAYRHQNQACVGFVDGHVKLMRRGDINRIAPTEDGRTLTNESLYTLWNDI